MATTESYSMSFKGAAREDIAASNTSTGKNTFIFGGFFQSDLACFDSFFQINVKEVFKIQT